MNIIVGDLVLREIDGVKYSAQVIGIFGSDECSIQYLDDSKIEYHVSFDELQLVQDEAFNVVEKVEVSQNRVWANAATKDSWVSAGNENSYAISKESDGKIHSELPSEPVSYQAPQEVYTGHNEVVTISHARFKILHRQLTVYL